MWIRNAPWKSGRSGCGMDPVFAHHLFLPSKIRSVEAARKMQQEAYHIMQAMNGIHPGDPTYNTDQNIAACRKTM